MQAAPYTPKRSETQESPPRSDFAPGNTPDTRRHCWLSWVGRAACCRHVVGRVWEASRPTQTQNNPITKNHVVQNDGSAEFRNPELGKGTQKPDVMAWPSCLITCGLRWVTWPLADSASTSGEWEQHHASHRKTVSQKGAVNAKCSAQSWTHRGKCQQVPLYGTAPPSTPAWPKGWCNRAAIFPLLFFSVFLKGEVVLNLSKIPLVRLSAFLSNPVYPPAFQSRMLWVFFQIHYFRFSASKKKKYGSIY